MCFSSTKKLVKSSGNSRHYRSGSYQILFLAKLKEDIIYSSYRRRI